MRPCAPVDLHPQWEGLPTAQPAYGASRGAWAFMLLQGYATNYGRAWAPPRPLKTGFGRPRGGVWLGPNLTT